ncbi:uncharacterized protein TM35_000332290 [Trypanosoma theileri]|uniref:Uncharacterized protein n=1 Tax=Trypanosoma theileri TaxID=67003 RepID=A0A1X0NLX8_9TRYP|nr:uncharacterized protein TM35_000332290 [Trypanosoma theileri]ORC85772.1 hypothetical protein TM35_000332290 [Trypanosoma theileri]
METLTSRMRLRFRTLWLKLFGSRTTNFQVKATTESFFFPPTPQSFFFKDRLHFWAQSSGNTEKEKHHCDHSIGGDKIKTDLEKRAVSLMHRAWRIRKPRRRSPTLPEKLGGPPFNSEL